MHQRRMTLGALALTVPLLLSACGGGDETANAAAGSEVRVVQADEGVELIAEPGTVVLDVRTPAEFAEGHVEGARNVDVNDPGFREAVKQLDPAVPYVVYCQSGNRSAAAAEIMAAEGFTDVADAGAFADLRAAGAPVDS